MTHLAQNQQYKSELFLFQMGHKQKMDIASSGSKGTIYNDSLFGRRRLLEGSFITIRDNTVSWFESGFSPHLPSLRRCCQHKISIHIKHALRAVLKHVPSWNMFHISVLCHSVKCAFLKCVSDWHCANFVKSKPHVECKILKHKNLWRDQK